MLAQNSVAWEKWSSNDAGFARDLGPVDLARHVDVRVLAHLGR